MSSRDDILASIRTNLPSLDRPLPYVPLFDDHAPTLLLNTFRVNLHRMGGVFLAGHERDRLHQTEPVLR